MKIMKLTLAALATIAAMVGFLWVTAPQSFREIYLCWKQAVSLTSCYRGGPIDFVADIDGFKYEGITGNFMDNQIFLYGAYEKPNLFLLRDLMRSIFAGQGTFIDIGANTGQHSMMISRYSKEVHAFEPWEPVLKRFRHMVERNGIKNISIHAFGLGDENSKKPFFKPGENNLATGSFVEGFRSENSLEGELEIQKGDDAFAKVHITSVSVIKMDIEGYEKLALLGLRQTLTRHRPILVFEVSVNPQSPVSIKSKEELVGLFPEKYEFLVISEKSDPLSGDYFLEPIDGIVRFDHAEQHDLVAYPIERKNSISLQGPKR
jgi:FkbM family methyltransferase